MVKISAAWWGEKANARRKGDDGAAHAVSGSVDAAASEVPNGCDGTKAGPLATRALALGNAADVALRSTECGVSFGVLPEFLGVAGMAF